MILAVRSRTQVSGASGARKLGYRSAPPMAFAKSTIAAENGATAHQLIAILCWDALKQREVYTRAADHRRLGARIKRLGNRILLRTRKRRIRVSALLLFSLKGVPNCRHLGASDRAFAVIACPRNSSSSTVSQLTARVW